LQKETMSMNVWQEGEKKEAKIGEVERNEEK
jgi:hypothetical protein